MSNARLVILFLGLIVLGSLGGIVYLSAASLSIPDVLVATVSGGLGALGAVLARTSDSPLISAPGDTVNIDSDGPDHRRDDRGASMVAICALVGVAVLVAIFIIAPALHR